MKEKRKYTRRHWKHRHECEGVDLGRFDDSSRSDGIKIFQVKIGEACKFCGATEKEDYKFMIEMKEFMDFIESQRDGDQYIGFRD